MAARSDGAARDVQAEIKFISLPEGHREEIKFAALGELSLSDAGWVDGADGWRAPFLADQQGQWASFPALEDLFIYNGSGVMPGRTWVIAPDVWSLDQRWERLLFEKDLDQKELLFHPHLRNGQPGDKHIRKRVNAGFPGHGHPNKTIAEQERSNLIPTRYAFRTLDRQWILPDPRVINQPNPNLWNGYSDQQIFLTGLERASPSNGPAITISDLIPDLDHYKGSFGGRVYPLWGNTEATRSNVKPALLGALSKTYGRKVLPDDVMAYVAAVMAHPAFTRRFADDLRRPGLRVPLTADAAIFDAAVTLGRDVVWLHCYGERFVDDDAGRPKGPPRMPTGQAPTIPKGGAIPGKLEPLPDVMSYDASKNRLIVGQGYVDSVSQEMVDYEVSGMNVLTQWFSYRKFDRSRPIIGDRRPPSPLSFIQPEHWPAEYTTDLLNLLNVLGRLIELEPKQAELLTRLLDGDLLDYADLAEQGAFETPPTAS